MPDIVAKHGGIEIQVDKVVTVTIKLSLGRTECIVRALNEYEVSPEEDADLHDLREDLNLALNAAIGRVR